MKVDLDKIETTAREAQEARPGDWIVDKLMSADVIGKMKPHEGYTIAASGCDLDVLFDPGVDHAVAHYIAECQPSVVLALVQRVGELERGNIASVYRTARDAFIAGALQPASAYDRYEDFDKWWDAAKPVVNPDSAKALQTVLALAAKVERGCNCEYDHRCGNCQTIVDLRSAVMALK